MTIRPSAAGLLAGDRSFQRSRARLYADSCPPGTAPSYPALERAAAPAESRAPPAAPLRPVLNTQEAAAEAHSCAAGPSEATPGPRPRQVPLPRPRPDMGDGWPPASMPWSRRRYVAAARSAGTAARRVPPERDDRRRGRGQRHSTGWPTRCGWSPPTRSTRSTSPPPAPPAAETTGQAHSAATTAQARVAGALAAGSCQTSWIAGLVFGLRRAPQRHAGIQRCSSGSGAVL